MNENNQPLKNTEKLMHLDKLRATKFDDNKVHSKSQINYANLFKLVEDLDASIEIPDMVDERYIDEYGYPNNPHTWILPIEKMNENSLGRLGFMQLVVIDLGDEKPSVWFMLYLYYITDFITIYEWPEGMKMLYFEKLEKTLEAAERIANALELIKEDGSFISIS
jgi:hypothetical protein